MTERQRTAVGPNDEYDATAGTNPVGALAMEMAELNERIGSLQDDIGEIPAKIIAGVNPPTSHEFGSGTTGRFPTFGRIVLLFIAGVIVAWLASPLSPFGQSTTRAVMIALALPLVCLGLLLGRATASRGR